MQHSLTVPIIGYHHSPLSQKFGIPRQPNLVDISSYIKMVAPYDTPDAFVGIADFSHLWVTWQTHHNQPQTGFKPQVRPPRLGGNKKLGVFATRSTYRPAQLGLSVVRLLEVENRAGKVILHIQGADMVDGTPIVDIKPYVAYSDAIMDAVSGFAPQAPKIKAVEMTATMQQQFDAMTSTTTNQNSLSKADVDTICQLIAQDPRPAYLQHEVGQMFVMRYKNIDIGFKMEEDGVLWLVEAKEVN
ncbi:tRNA (N6-threonylcarbamoyladenosine(37)-N6)-methyltransferase TrmO [Psychrobacter sp. I-STPA6b]|uniref:tRNA (N6-threonylcarbamoyladenosine(37)-N6)-methyltransferase TrmO n=1 Tax=Psychrobacter sp. I-STPA6b TaxID=2585718 RepID=UPI001D0C8DE2|nr:tRNA (N6-threonylcarbamoyladenosine(37)-N6)-methyltransferase TrmO [Psychrobacter sp. I-STPA6b]